MTQIIIDQPWLQAHQAPYLLDQAATTYLLTVDVIADRTAFVLAAADVVLNGNGHSVTYGNLPLIDINGEFENGNTDKWDLSQAPAAALAPNENYLFGNSVLRLNNFSAPQVLYSDPITVPVSPSQYTARVSMSAPGGTQNSPIATVQIDILAADKTTLIAAGTTGGGYNADGSVATTYLNANVVILRITVTPQGAGTTIDLDHVTFSLSGDYGIVASGEWEINGWQNLPSQYRSCTTPTIQNIQIIQGQHCGHASSPLMMRSVTGDVVIESVACRVNGDDTEAIVLYNTTGNKKITECLITYQGGDVDHRASVLAAINLQTTSGTILLQNNKIISFPQIGINLIGPTAGPIWITNNTLLPKSVVTNGYAILLVELQNFVVEQNYILSEGCHGGISIDSYWDGPLSSGEICNNTIDVTGKPNREYGVQIPVMGLRIRNDSGPGGAIKDLHIHDNSVTARSSKDSVNGAFAARLSLANVQGRMDDAGLLLENNTFVASSDGDRVVAFCLDGMDYGINPLIRANTFTADQVALWIGGMDGDGIGEYDTTFDGNALNAPVHIRCGYYLGKVANVIVKNSTPQDLTVQYTGPKAIEQVTFGLGNS